MKPSRLVAQTRIDTPLGPLTAAATEEGLAGLWFDDQGHHPGPLDAPENAAQRWLAQARDELAAYWAGEARFSVALDLQGTPFQRAVWQASLAIAPGDTSTYGNVAACAGAPAAVRAAGGAIGRNPVSIIVPCHRVIGRDGSLTGYDGGLHRKRALLQLEGVQMPAPGRPKPASSPLGGRARYSATGCQEVLR
jgi:methylated-DNA-[protein]-cysteine S-methyltransferase